MNKKLKNFFIGTWDCLVFIAYIKFYIMCICGFLLVMVLSIYVLDQAGEDITVISGAVQWVGYMGIFWLGIIMLDKANMMSFKDKVRNLNNEGGK